MDTSRSTRGPVHVSPVTNHSGSGRWSGGETSQYVVTRYQGLLGFVSRSGSKGPTVGRGKVVVRDVPKVLVKPQTRTTPGTLCP